MASRGDAARVELIETAEQVFAERGIEAASLRDISRAAGQRNHSAAQYHFGDRAGLVAAVFDHRMRIVNERRHARFDELEADGLINDLRSLVEATIEPLVEVVAECAGWYGRFLVRARWDTFAWQVVRELPVLSSWRRAIVLLSNELTELSEADRMDRIEQLQTLFVGTIAGWEWRRQLGEPVPAPAQYCADLVSTCHAVLTAPVPALKQAKEFA